MVSFNVSAFAQRGPADPAVVMPRFVAQTLRAAGLEVKRGDERGILIVEEQLVLRVPSTLQDWEDIGILASLVEDSERRFSLFRPQQTDDPADKLLRFVQFAQDDLTDDLLRFAEFKQCLDTADFINKVRYTACGVGPTSPSNLFCKTGVLLDHVGDSLNCIFTYLCTPENNFCA